MSRTSGRWTAAVAVLAAATLAVGVQPATAKPKADQPTKLAEKLVKQVSANGANRHLIAFQRIADANGGTRASNTPGYDASVDYVAGRLRNAGFQVTTPEFTYEEEVPVADDLTVGATTFEAIKMQFSVETPVGGITAPLVVLPDPADGDATPGCETTDYAGVDAVGKIAVVRRGSCFFAVKADNAAAAGAIGLVVSNNAPGPLSGVTLGEPKPIPVGGVSQADGDALKALSGQTATLDIRSEIVERTSRNVIAQTRTGRTDNVVMAGAHLDSVPAGPGINDNGTGSASLLELATRMGGSPKVNNAVRFGFWGSEELGLLGSEAYVASLSFEQQLNIAMYLNFDMVGSPNAGYFVYDGDDSDAEGAGPGPFGSAQIEKTFVDFFANRLPVDSEGTDFSGRSDYGPFIAVGIPSGGLFTGAEGIKTAEQAAKWGGTADVAYDPCYHQACDNLGNVNRVALDRNLDAIAWAVGVYAYSTEDVNGVPARAARAELRQQSKMALTAEDHSHAKAA